MIASTTVLPLFICWEIYQGAARTRCITLNPSEVTASVNIKFIKLGWITYFKGDRVVSADWNNMFLQKRKYCEQAKSNVKIKYVEKIN